MRRPRGGDPEAQPVRERRTIRRVVTALALILSLLLLLWWLPPSSRRGLLHGLIANRLLIALVTLFGLVALSLLWTAGQRLDVRLLTALNVRGYHSARMDRLMRLASQIGSARAASLLVIGSYVLGAHRFAIELALGSISLALVVTVLKILTDRARPFRLLAQTRVIGSRTAGLSFPSGHTTQAFFTMTLLLRHLQGSLVAAVGLYGLGALVAYARVHLGVHYPRDVIAGAILGLLWGALSFLVVSRP